MFFGYPIAATVENWLHDALCETVGAIHQNLDAADDTPKWPDIIPAAYRNRLSSRTGLRDRLWDYTAAADGLELSERAQVLHCIREQNDIAGLVSGATDCERLADLPEVIRDPATKLFGFAFELLTDLAIRDAHYVLIYDANPYHVCPFCGLEYFDAPGAPREDLDHYLASSKYPFAAANLRNLSPMGKRCNSSYKHADDILRDNNGNRRPSFDPYADRRIVVSLRRSVPFAGTDGRLPQWQVDFVPNSAECVTWDEVLEIRGRIKRDVLDPSFRRWLRDFATWFVKRKGVHDLSDQRLVQAVREHAEDMADQGFKAREFLRAHVLEMLLEHMLNDNRRLLEFVRDLVTQSVPQPAPSA